MSGPAGMADGDHFDTAVAAAFQFDRELPPPQMVERDVRRSPNEGIADNENFAGAADGGVGRTVFEQRLARPMSRFTFIRRGFSAVVFFDDLVVQRPLLAGGPAAAFERAE